MNRFPEEVLLHIFQYISPRQIGKLLRVNRWFNYVLSRNSISLKRIEVILYFDLKISNDNTQEIEFGMLCLRNNYKFAKKTEINIRLLIGNDRIAIETGSGGRSWRSIAEYLAWRTGSTVKKGVKIDSFKSPAFVVPVGNPQEAFLAILNVLATRIEVRSASIVYSPAFTVDFRWKIWNCLASAGVNAYNCRAFGPATLEEVLYLNANLGIRRFRFNMENDDNDPSLDRFLLETTGGNEDYDSTFIDGLLQYVHRLVFVAYMRYELESPESLYFPIKEWLLGSFDKFVAVFYAKSNVFAWIAKNFNPHIVEIGSRWSVHWTIWRNDGKWLWIRGDRHPFRDKDLLKFTFCDLEEDIRGYSKDQISDIYDKYYGYITQS